MPYHGGRQTVALLPIFCGSLRTGPLWIMGACPLSHTHRHPALAAFPLPLHFSGERQEGEARLKLRRVGKAGSVP